MSTNDTYLAVFLGGKNSATAAHAGCSAANPCALPTPPPKLDVQGLTLSDYAGMYHYAPDRAWIVDVDNGKLQWRTKAGRPPRTCAANRITAELVASR